MYQLSRLIRICNVNSQAYNSMPVVPAQVKKHRNSNKGSNEGIELQASLHIKCPGFVHVVAHAGTENNCTQFTESTES